MDPRKVAVLSLILSAVIFEPSVLFAGEGTTAKKEEARRIE